MWREREEREGKGSGSARYDACFHAPLRLGSRLHLHFRSPSAEPRIVDEKSPLEFGWYLLFHLRFCVAVPEIRDQSV
jgi:hypothetical protein